MKTARVTHEVNGSLQGHFVVELSMTVTGRIYKFAMRQKMIDDLHLDQSKTT